MLAWTNERTNESKLFKSQERNYMAIPQADSDLACCRVSNSQVFETESLEISASHYSAIAVALLLSLCKFVNIDIL